MRNFLFIQVAAIGIWALLGMYSYRTQLEELQKEHQEINRDYDSISKLYNNIANYDYHVELHSDSLATIIDYYGNTSYNIPGDSIQVFIENDNL